MLKKVFLLLLVPCYLAAGPGDSSFVLRKSAEYNSLLLFNLGYRLPVVNSEVINSGHGVAIEAGVNPAAFIFKRTIIALYGGWSWKDNLWSTGFSDNFTRHYKNSLNIEQQTNELDSAIIASSVYLFENRKGRSLTMPGCEMASFHDYALYYGIWLKLPFKYLPSIKIYKGTTRAHYQGGAGIITLSEEYTILQLRRDMHGCEVMLHDPVGILYGKGASWFSKMAISLYFEHYNFYSSELHFNDGDQKRNIALTSFTRNDFLQKYKSDYRLGCKISVNLM